MITITTLACHRDVEMALLSLKSFINNYKDTYRIHVYEDGSLNQEDKDLLRTLPGVSIKDKREVDALTDQALRKYPNCRQWRGENAFTVKLFDMAVVEQSDYVYFDSDVFFIKGFKGLDRRNFGNEELVLMSDRFDYYSLNYKERFIHPRVKFPKKINAGFYYLRNGALDWELFEWLFSKQEYFPRDREPWRVSLADQTAWALLGANTDARIWKKDQVLIPTSLEDITPSTIAVHLIKRLEGFDALYTEVEKMALLERAEIYDLETQDLAYSNLVSAAFEKIKFRFVKNK